MLGVRWWLRAAPAAVFWFVAYVYLTVPDVRPLARENPRTTAFMRMREAESRGEGRARRTQQRWVPYSRISENLKRAVLVAEDSAFWRHDGLDYEQIRESMEINFERLEFARGASTITQQLAKNLYLSPSRNPVRKLRELLITRRLEAVLTKRRILELYLNVIEWGDGVWGAEAAARAHFGRPASAVSAEQAALLAGAIINPRVLDASAPGARLLRRQRLILRRMRRATPPGDQVPASVPAVPAASPETPAAPVSAPQSIPPDALPAPAPAGMPDAPRPGLFGLDLSLPGVPRP
jgi:monofunctional biosynthetic peptidoglycan transglycosylase